MLVSARQLDRTSLTADVAVVGAGAVGLAVAVDLARAGKTVLLLEAGGEVTATQPPGRFDTGIARGYPLDGLRSGRARGLGGTTHLWAGQLVPLEPIVFEERPWVTDAAWPLSNDELRPAYDRAYALLGLAAALPDAEVARRLAIAPPTNAPDLELFFTRWTPQVNFARWFDEDIRCNERLFVVVDAPVTAVELGDDRATVTGFKARTPSGGEIVARAAHFVLANGTVEIARLMSLPDADGVPPPWADNPWLGRGFVDHIDAFAGKVTLTDAKRFHALFDGAFIGSLKYKAKLRLSADAQRRCRLVSAFADFVFDSERVEDLAVLKGFARGILARQIDGSALRTVIDQPKRLASLAGLAVPMVSRYVRHHRTYNPGDKGIRLRLSTEQKPVGNGRLRLLPETDAFGVPAVEVEWAIDGEEVRAMAALSEAVAAFLREVGLAEVEIDPRLVERDRAFLATIDDANHQMGMARLAEDPTRGVVDRDLKVFGTRNLFVAGAAVFPTTGAANPTLTAIALGLRMSAKLRS